MILRHPWRFQREVVAGRAFSTSPLKKNVWTLRGNYFPAEEDRKVRWMEKDNSWALWSLSDVWDQMGLPLSMF